MSAYRFMRCDICLSLHAVPEGMSKTCCGTELYIVSGDGKWQRELTWRQVLRALELGVAEDPELAMDRIHLSGKTAHMCPAMLGSIAPPADVAYLQAKLDQLRERPESGAIPLSLVPLGALLEHLRKG